jgi:PAS domain S-box-containing protein
VDDRITAEHLRQVVERLTDGIVLLDRQGSCLYLNPEAARILGQRSSDVLGQPLSAMIADAVRWLPEEARSRVVAGEELLLCRSFFAQGRWYEVLGRPMGEGFLIHFRDVTERLQAESARRQSEERFRLFVNGVRDHALIMLDPKGQIANWNIGAERISGFTANEVMGKHLSIFFSADAVQMGEVRRRLEGAVKHGSQAAEGWFTRKDGTRVLVQTIYNCLYDELGEPTGFAMVTRDITEQRQMQERLRVEMERLRLAVEAGGVGTFEENLQTGTAIVDPQGRELLGYRPDQSGNFEDFIPIVHPDDRHQIEDIQKRVFAVPGGGQKFEVEYRVTRPCDGKLRWMESQGKVLESATEPGGRRLLGVIRDATKRHEVDEFRKLAAGIIAHDLRAPLSAIKLSSEVMMRGEGLPAAAVRKLKEIVHKVDRMAHMVEQLLLYSQAQFGGGVRLDLELTNLEEVCRHAVDDVRAVNPHCEVHLESHGDCRGFWDPTRLTEMTANLVANAITHGQPGQPVDIVAGDEGDRVALVIHNTGPPIPPELLSVIFEPFRRAPTPRRRRQESFGLGLYITREIVAAHDGTIEVSSSASAGTTFAVHLPRHRAAHPVAVV